MASTKSLDLYAKVEDLLGVDEAIAVLYAHYLLALQSVSFDSLLDVGCGSGGIVHALGGAFEGAAMRGIDLSPLMVKHAKEQGIDAECIDLCDVQGQFDVITATFDMVNYIEPDILGSFLSCLHARLSDGGIFLCDINTQYGFAEVAVGSHIVDDESRFLTIDSDYEDEVYTADFTLFEREGKCYSKSQGQIRQYYHTAEQIAMKGGFALVSQDPVALYGEESDKLFLVLRKQ